MDTATSRPTSVLAITPGDEWFYVRYRSNADCGYDQEFFEFEGEARTFAAALVYDPPKGNYFHPAPEGDLDIRIFRVRRLHT